MRLSGILFIAVSLLNFFGIHGTFVYPAIIEGREYSGARKMLAITASHILQMEEVSIFAETFKTKIQENEPDGNDSLNASVLQRNMYQCTKTKATYTISFYKGGLLVQGIVNSTHAIKPSRRTTEDSSAVPHDLFSILPTQNSASTPEREGTLHTLPTWQEKLTKIGSQEDFGFSKKAVTEKRDIGTPTRLFRNKRFEVETHLVVDSAIRKLFKREKKFLQYLGILMNVANLKLQSLRTHNISLLVVGVTVLEEKRNEEDVFVYKEGFVDAFATLKKFGNYVSKNSTLQKSDIAVLLCGRQLVSWSGKFRQNVSGQAEISGVCVPPINVATVKDVGRVYHGSNTLAHEVGHLLGAHHDGPSNPKYRYCDAFGYIMQPFLLSDKADTFSGCSEMMIEDNFLNMTDEEYLDCINIKSTQKKLSDEKHLIPMSLTADDFCKRLGMEKEVTGELRRCAIHCYKGVISKQNEVGIYPAPYGFRCGHGEVCYYGKCVKCTDIGTMEPWENCTNI